MGQRDGIEFSSGQLPIHIFVVDMFSPFYFKRFGFLPTTLGDIEPFVGERTAHAAEHAAINHVANGRFHHAPRRGRGKKDRLLRSEQRLELWMNCAVKILKIFTAMPNQRAGKRRPGFFGNFDGARDKKLIVRMHDETSDACRTRASPVVAGIGDAGSKTGYNINDSTSP